MKLSLSPRATQQTGNLVKGQLSPRNANFSLSASYATRPRRDTYPLPSLTSLNSPNNNLSTLAQLSNSSPCIQVRRRTTTTTTSTTTRDAQWLVHNAGVQETVRVGKQIKASREKKRKQRKVAIFLERDSREGPLGLVPLLAEEDDEKQQEREKETEKEKEREEKKLLAFLEDAFDDAKSSSSPSTTSTTFPSSPQTRSSSCLSPEKGSRRLRLSLKSPIHRASPSLSTIAE